MSESRTVAEIFSIK